MTSLAALGVPHLVDIGIATVGAVGLIAPPHLLHEFHRSRLVGTSPWDGLDDLGLILADPSFLPLVCHDIIIDDATVESSIILDLTADFGAG